MTMNNEYFRDKVLKLMPMFHNLAINLVGEDEPEIVDVLIQIARDAAEAQRYGCWNWCGGSGCPTCAAELEIPHD